MRGFVEIYQGKGDDMELIHADDNIIVDGAREHIVDILTFTPPPTRTSNDLSSTAKARGISYLPASGVLDTSNFNVRGFTLGSARENYDFRHAKYTPSSAATHNKHTGFYHLLPYFNNHDFRSTSWNEYSPYEERVEIFEDNKFENVGFDLIKQHGINSLGINNPGSFTNFTKTSENLFLPGGWNGACPIDAYIGPGVRGRGLRLRKTYGSFWFNLVGSVSEKLLRIDQTYKITLDILARDDISTNIIVWDQATGGPPIFSNGGKLGQNSFEFTPRIGSSNYPWDGRFQIGYYSVADSADYTIDNLKLFHQINQAFSFTMFDTSLADFDSLVDWVPDLTYNESGYKQSKPEYWTVYNQDYENWERGDKDGTRDNPTIPENYVSSVAIDTSHIWTSLPIVSGLCFNRIADTENGTSVSALSMDLYTPDGVGNQDRWEDLSAGTYKLTYSWLGSDSDYESQLYIDNYPQDEPVNANTPYQEIAFLDTTPGTSSPYIKEFAYGSQHNRSIEFTVPDQSENRPLTIGVNNFIDTNGTNLATIPIRCGIDHFRLSRRIGEDTIPAHWELILQGSPSFGSDTSGPGLEFKSSEVGDQATLRQNIALKKGNSYRFNITASGTDPVKIGLYRQRHAGVSVDAREYFDFDKGIFLSRGKSVPVRYPRGSTVASGLPVDPDKSIFLTKHRKTHSVDFRLPENPVDRSAFGEESISYFWEIKLPADSSDFLSDISIASVDLINLEEEVLRNSNFSETESIIPNSDLFRKQLAPEYVTDINGSRMLGIYDFSGPLDNPTQFVGDLVSVQDPTDATRPEVTVRQWGGDTHNPIVISKEGDLWNARNVSGSVSYVMSSVDVSSVTDEGYLDIRTIYRGYGGSKVGTARFGASFFLSEVDQLKDSLGNLPNSDRSREVPMQLSFWYSTENPAASAPLSVQVFSDQISTGVRNYYSFSSYDPYGNDPNMDGWTDRTTWSQVIGNVSEGYLGGPSLPPTDQGKWRKASAPIVLMKDMYDNPEDHEIHIRFRPVGQSSNIRSTYIKGISLGPTPGWKYAHLGPSSTVSFSERDTLVYDSFGHTIQNSWDAEDQYIGTVFSGLVPNEDYTLMVRYKSSKAANVDVLNLQMSGVVSDYTDWRYYNWNADQKSWPKYSTGGTATKKKLTGTAGNYVTSSLPIMGMNHAGFTVDQEYFLRLGYESDATIEFDYIKLVRTPRIAYTGPFHKDSLSPWQTIQNNQAHFSDDPFYWGDGVSVFADSSATRVELITSGSEGGYIQVTNPFDIEETDGRVRWSKTQKDLGINKGDIVTVAYGQYDVLTGALSDQFLVITVWDPITEEQWYWNGSDWSTGWEYVQKDGASIGPSTDTGDQNYPFKEIQASGIPIDGHYLHDDTRWKVISYTRNSDGGTPPYVHRRSPLRIYKTGKIVTATDSEGNPKTVFNQNHSYASALPSVGVAPMDKTLQPTSVDGSGPARLGHFLNAIEFSGSPEFSSMKLEQVVQAGCFLPGSGLELDRYSFGHTDKSESNAFSGVLSGMLNQQSVINSEGYIMEASGSVSSYTVKDSSAGFVVSAYPIDNSFGLSAINHEREVKYVLTLTPNDWKLLDYYYGGIANIGLHVFDLPATAKKFAGVSSNHLSFLNRTKGTPYGTAATMGAGGKTSLYNLTDTTKNPVFKLFAKKIFQPGGLRMNSSDYNDFMTIVWTIKF